MMKSLVVDDLLSMRRIITNCLKKLRYDDVVEAESETEDGKIVITGKAFPGTRIVINGATIDIDETITNATFTKANGKVVAKV